MLKLKLQWMKIRKCGTIWRIIDTIVAKSHPGAKRLARNPHQNKTQPLFGWLKQVSYRLLCLKFRDNAFFSNRRDVTQHVKMQTWHYCRNKNRVEIKMHTEFLAWYYVLFAVHRWISQRLTVSLWLRVNPCWTHSWLLTIYNKLLSAKNFFVISGPNTEEYPRLFGAVPSSSWSKYIFNKPLAYSNPKDAVVYKS